MKHERYQYVECGLDNVYLLNGFERFRSARGTSIAIRDVDKLHMAIGLLLCRERKDFCGKEIRFVRRELLMTQLTLAHLLKVTEQTVHRWEAEKCRMPKAAETIIRLLYAEQATNGRESVRNRLKRIADLEDEMDRMREMNFELMLDEENRGLSDGASARWKLVA